MKKPYMHTIKGSSRAYPIKIMMLFWCLILRFTSLSIKLKLCELKLVKASINVCNISCKSCTRLYNAKKNKHLQELSMLTFTKKIFLKLT